MRYNERGEEILDDTPVEAPIKFRRPPTIHELIALHVRAATQVDHAMGADDEENFVEDADGDDILTPYELHAMAGEADDEFRRAKQAKAVVDSLRKKEENKDTVNGDRTKESGNVQSGRVEGDRRGVGGSGEIGVASGGEGGSAGNRSGGVSKGGAGDSAGDAQGRK